jgi:hypothetical protein
MEKSMVICFVRHPYNKNGKQTGYGGVIVGKMKWSKLLTVIVSLLLIGWPLYQIYKQFYAHSEQKNGVHLLYQVTLFQMESLNSALADSAAWTETQQLNILKQAAYSAMYTHERFTMLIGTQKLTALQSVSRMMDYIGRLQVGGNRPITPAEKQALQDAGKLYKPLYEAYNHLMASTALDIAAAQNAQIKKLDRTLSDFFSKKLLQ